MEFYFIFEVRLEVCGSVEFIHFMLQMLQIYFQDWFCH
jgi:hypothetical protein